MINHYLTSIRKNIKNNGLIVLINTISFSIGIALLALILIILNFQFGFDKFHKNGERLFIIQESISGQKPYFVTVPAAFPNLLLEFPEIENGTRLLQAKADWIKFNNVSVNKALTYADTGFFSVFTFPLQLGDSKTALTKPNSAVLSEEMSTVLFGTSNPLGKLITIGSGRYYTITGIMKKIPLNSINRPDIVIPIKELERLEPNTVNNWNSSYCPTYLLLRKENDASIVEKSFTFFVNKYFKENSKNRSLKLVKYYKIFETQAGIMYKVTIYGLAIIFIFLSIIIFLNFFNLTSLTTLARSQVIAIKQTLGASKQMIYIQYFIENLLISLFAFILGLFLLYLVLPQFNLFFETNFEFPLTQEPILLLILFSLILLISLISSVFPINVINNTKIIKLLAGKKISFGSLQFARTIITFFQFLIAITLTTATGVILLQSDYLKNSKLGFESNQIILADLELDYDNTTIAYSRINSLLEELRGYAGVEEISTSSSIPGKFLDNYVISESDNKQDIMLKSTLVDNNYFKLFNIKILKGRAFDRSFSSDSVDAIILNKKAIETLGIKNPINYQMKLKGNNRLYTIVGVSDDYHYRGLNKDIEPVIHFCNGNSKMAKSIFLCIKLKNSNDSFIRNLLKEKFENIITRKEFSYNDMTREFNKQYFIIDKTQTFLTFVSILTVIIACTGVFGLSLFVINQKYKEIAIRKILGASLYEVILTLIGRLIILLLLALLMSIPITYVLMSKWLNAFATKIKYPWWITLFSGLSIIFIMLIVISRQVYKASLVNPIQVLNKD
jgi:putative ABC transport system permease protein